MFGSKFSQTMHSLSLDSQTQADSAATSAGPFPLDHQISCWLGQPDLPSVQIILTFIRLTFALLNKISTVMPFENY